MNNLKRIEIPLWWNCNIDCIFCSEIDCFKDNRWTSLSFEKFSSILFENYNKWYNHLTIVWWEPTIEKDFLKVLKLAKKLWMKIQISTNWFRLINSFFCKQLLDLVDWITISIHSIDDKINKKIINKNIINLKLFYKKIFDNINNNFNNNEIRINYVLNKFNYKSDKILSTFEFIYQNLKNIENFTLTYPDIVNFELQKTQIKNISIKIDAIKKQFEIINLPKDIEKKLIISNYPFCWLPKKFWKYNEDLKYDKENITKTNLIEWEFMYFDRKNILPRAREKIDICKICIFNEKCWGIPPHYKKIFDIKTLKPILEF